MGTQPEPVGEREDTRRVRGRCPACGSETLFLGDSGYVTCSLIDCPNPSAPSKLLTDPSSGLPGEPSDEAVAIVADAIAESPVFAASRARAALRAAYRVDGQLEAPGYRDEDNVWHGPPASRVTEEMETAAARQLALADVGDPSWEQMMEAEQDVYRTPARAALQAALSASPHQSEEEYPEALKQMKSGSREYTEEQSAAIEEAVANRKPLDVEPLPIQPDLSEVEAVAREMRALAEHTPGLVYHQEALELADRLDSALRPKEKHSCDSELRAQPDYSAGYGTPVVFNCSCGKRWEHYDDEAEGDGWAEVSDSALRAESE